MKRRWQFHSRTLCLGVACAGLAGTTWTLADGPKDSRIIPMDSLKRTYDYQIGPIPELTTTWHAAPFETAIPAGIQLELRRFRPIGAPIVWRGASESAYEPTMSYAICALLQRDELAISAEITMPELPLHERLAGTYLHVVDIPASLVRAGSLQTFAIPPFTLTEQSTNEQTMSVFFGFPSVATIQQIAPGLYETSVNRRIGHLAEANFPEFTPLLEWSFDGAAVTMGRQATTEFRGLGTHTVVVGPPGRSAEAQIQMYRTRITSHATGRDIVPQGEPITFTAVTDPPGYEDRITWISSTQYGTARPVIGHGPTFTVQFDNTFGPNPDPSEPGLWQWLGVRADNSEFGQDQKIRCRVLTFDVPANRSGCVNQAAGGGNRKVGESFNMNATFDSPCRCCEYRQEVKGRFRFNGMALTHVLCTTNLMQDTYQEDGVNSGGLCLRYGHRVPPMGEGDVGANDIYDNLDRPTGCRYRGFDFPGITGPVGFTYLVDLMFRGRIVDVCNGNMVIRENEWTVNCAGTTIMPENQPVREAHFVDQFDETHVDVHVAAYANDELSVVVSIPNGTGEAPIGAGEVDATIKGLNVLDRPTGTLIETHLGGGVSAHAIYRFEYPEEMHGQPLHLTITFRGETDARDVNLP